MPLTRITSNKQKFKWTKIKQDPFDEIKRIVDCDTLLTSPNFHEIFKTHTNDSVFQLGVVISPKLKATSLYSRKLTDAHKRYTLADKELLSIVKSLKYFKPYYLFGK